MTEYEEMSLELLASIFGTQMSLLTLTAKQSESDAAVAKSVQQCRANDRLLENVANAIAVSVTARSNQTPCEPRIRTI